MPSPVIPDSIPEITSAMEPCEVMAALIESVKQLTALVGYLFTDEGMPQLEAAREFGAIALPPGTLMHFHFSEGTSETEIRRKVEIIWLLPHEITAYDSPELSVSSSIEPFWTVADEKNKHSAPDVSGRFLLAAHLVPETTSPSGVIGMGPPLGAKEVTLSIDQMPVHDHDVIAGQAEGTDADPYAGRFLFTPKEGRIQEGAGVVDPSPKNFPEIELGKKAGGDKPHPNMPPYFITVVAYRTKRMA